MCMGGCEVIEKFFFLKYREEPRDHKRHFIYREVGPLRPHTWTLWERGAITASVDGSSMAID